MKKRWGLFLAGLLLFLVALPMGSLMILESIHQQQIKKDYVISNIMDEATTTSPIFFNKQIIEIKETPKDTESYIDPWQFKIQVANVSIQVNGSTIHTLKDVPVRVEETNSNRYYGNVAFLQVNDTKEEKTSVFILLKTTRDIQKELPNGRIVEHVPEEKLVYALYELDEEGKVTSTSLDFTNRNALQTQLLNQGSLTPYAIGYYTNAWHTYPTIIFPFIYPFGFLLIGFVMMLFTFLKRKTKK